MGTTVLVVSHKLVIGAVAARAAGITEPGAVFDAAGALDLPPAGWWHPSRVSSRGRRAEACSHVIYHVDDMKTATTTLFRGCPRTSSRS
jgi:broad specificity phosphatase PhoE